MSLASLSRAVVTVAAVIALAPAVRAQSPMRIAVAGDRAGAEPTRFLPLVGNWVVAVDSGRTVVLVDGREWKRGQPANGLADKARAIYGSRHEEFIDNVKAFAYFPIAVAKDVDDFQNGEISMRFKLVGGTLDKCAGILFNVKPNGDYLTVRFNGTEDNLVLWKFEQGKRSFVKKGVENVPIAMNTWHDMKIVVKGTQLEGWLDGRKLLDYTLPASVTGKVGLWSKTDSMSEFDDFVVRASR
ncbi:MAG: family 16 glycoside hydrolase [Gemmatimonadaceae bacterium]